MSTNTHEGTLAVVRRVFRVTPRRVLILLWLVVCWTWAWERQTKNRLETYLVELRSRGERLTYADLGVVNPPWRQQAGNPAGAIWSPPGEPLKDKEHPLAPTWLDQRPRFWRRPFLASLTGKQLSWAEAAALLDRRPPGKRPEPGVNAAAFLGDAVLIELNRDRREAARGRMLELVRLPAADRETHDLSFQGDRVTALNTAVAVLWQCLQYGGWDDATLQAWQSALHGCSVRHTLTGALEFERAAGYLDFERRCEDPLQSTLLWRHVFCHADLQLHVQYLQACIDGARSFALGDAWQEIRAELGTADEQLERSVQAEPWCVAPLTYARLVEAGVRAPSLDATAVAESWRMLALAALALERYRLQHHDLPDRLSRVFPDFIPVPPVDPMTAQTLRYTRPGAGRFRLYSVGVNGRDDDGNPLSSQTGWSGGSASPLDLVWPVPQDDPQEDPAEAKDLLPIIRFEDAQLGDALKTLARQAQWNILFDPQITQVLQNPITIEFENISARQALRWILGTQGLRVQHDLRTDIWRVTSQ